jgi:heterodisulfide reductase subunit C
MSLKVMPCPFCEAQPKIIGPILTCVECPACGARGPRGMDIPDAVDKWNRVKTAEEIRDFAAAHSERVLHA